MNNIVGLKELRQNVDRYASAIQKGQSFIVVRKSKPIFKITPFKAEEGEWEEVIDFTKIKKGGVKIDDLLKRI